MHSDRRDLHTRILTSPPLRLVISTRNPNRSTCLPRNVQFRRSLPLRNSFYRVFVLPPDICSRAIAFHGRNPGAALARLSHFQVAFIRITIPSSCFFPWQFKSSLDIQSIRMRLLIFGTRSKYWQMLFGLLERLNLT